VDKCAGTVAVDAMVRGDGTPQDFDTFKLYEWACEAGHPSGDHSEALNTLGVRLVKANPRSGLNAEQILRRCVEQWDLANAQQVSVPQATCSPLFNR
jgi:hypothetical protein